MRSQASRFSLNTLVMVLAASFLGSDVLAQVTPLDHDRGGIGLGLALRRLPVDGAVLYITAHPDDENNGVLVKLSRGKGIRTGLLTVTRGDGGQNEIGPELFQAIGILRSEELAGVHRYDGAQQFFTRAFEFGYSFSVEETFEKWGRQEILEDVVDVVRSFRPDVVLTLPREGRAGGQHHMASARLAEEAFRVAADPARFAHQIDRGLRPWQPAKVYEVASIGFGGGRPAEPDPSMVRVDTSHYDPLLGMSWHQFGGLGRAHHRCQGMGQLMAAPGQGEGRYKLIDAEPAVEAVESDIFEGVDMTLRRWLKMTAGEAQHAAFLEPGIAEIEDAIESAQKAFSITAPHATLAPLAAGLEAVRGLRAKVKASQLSTAVAAELAHRLDLKEQDFTDALRLAQGLEAHLVVDDGDVVPGQTFEATATIWNQSAGPVSLDDVKVDVPDGWSVEKTGGEAAELAGGAVAELVYSITVATEARSTQPYWKRNFEVDRFDIEIPEHHTAPWSPPDVTLGVGYTTQGVSASLKVPAYHRFDGPWVGREKQKVVNVVPALSVALSPSVAIVPTGSLSEPREFRVQVDYKGKAASSASVAIQAPDGWTVEPAEATLSFQLENEQGTARFFVTPPAGSVEGEVELRAVATHDGREYREGYQVIAYDHTQERHLFHPATAAVKILDVDLGKDISVGYVRGSGDRVPPAIEMLGAPITFLTPDDIAFGDLSQYTTIMTGIRAYQTRTDLKAHHQRLLEYVKGGGNLVVQYNKFEFNQLGPRPTRRPRPGEKFESPFAPYPAAVGRNRITVEEAPITVLDTDSPLLVAPNRIGAEDFSDWVQERGLYFLDAHDERYIELFSSEDPWPKNAGEKKGMLVTTTVGKGTWTYVGLGLWRQLPAGTPGAYRILANLLSQPRGD